MCSYHAKYEYSEVTNEQKFWQNFVFSLSVSWTDFPYEQQSSEKYCVFGKIVTGWAQTCSSSWKPVQHTCHENKIKLLIYTAST